MKLTASGCIGLPALLISLPPLPAGAQVVQAPLDTLLEGGPNAGRVSAGAWHFEAFSFHSTGSIPVDPSEVLVQFVGDPGRNTLSFTWERDSPPAGGEAAFDVGYRATGEFPFGVSAGLRFNGPVPSQGAGGDATVVDTVTLADGRQITLDVFNDGPGRLDDDNSDLANLPGALARRDTHASLVAAGGPLVHLQFVHNLIEPLPDFPEPTAVAFAPALCLLLRRRRP